MAIAFVQEFDAPDDDRSTSNYDAIAEALGTRADPPAGAIVHTAGWTPDGTFRIFDVWESEDALQRFITERLLPTLERVLGAEALAANPPSREYTYTLHDLQQL